MFTGVCLSTGGCLVMGGPVQGGAWSRETWSQGGTWSWGSSFPFLFMIMTKTTFALCNDICNHDTENKEFSIQFNSNVTYNVKKW